MTIAFRGKNHVAGAQLQSGWIQIDTNKRNTSKVQALDATLHGAAVAGISGFTRERKPWRSRPNDGHEFELPRARDRARIGLSNVVTIVVGHFVAQIVTDQINPGSIRPGPWETKLIQIWPIQKERVTWTPRVSFTNGAGNLGSNPRSARFAGPTSCRHHRPAVASNGPRESLLAP